MPGININVVIHQEKGGYACGNVVCVYNYCSTQLESDESQQEE